jgi:hypothetical protein
MIGGSVKIVNRPTDSVNTCKITKSTVILRSSSRDIPRKKMFTRLLRELYNTHALRTGAMRRRSRFSR